MSTDNRFLKIYLYKRIVSAKLFIDNHFSDKIDLNNIADEAFFSKFHFIRLFHHLYGKTPYQYLLLVRIEKAKLLLSENMPVAKVCYRIGFESASSFTGLFKRVVGQTPTDYQLEQKRKRDEIVKAPLKFIPNCFAESKGWKTRGGD